MAQDEGQGEDDDGRDGDDRRRQEQEGQGQHARQRDMVQDAEEDEDIRQGEPGRAGDEDRGAGDQGDPAQIIAAVEALARRQHQAEADDRQEGTGDQPGEGTPGRIGDDIDPDQPKVREIIGEVVDEHREQRDAAGQIDQFDTAAGRRVRLLAHGVVISGAMRCAKGR